MSDFTVLVENAKAGGSIIQFSDGTTKRVTKEELAELEGSTATLDLPLDEPKLEEPKLEEPKIEEEHFEDDFKYDGDVA